MDAVTKFYILSDIDYTTQDVTEMAKISVVASGLVEMANDQLSLYADMVIPASGTAIYDQWNTTIAYMASELYSKRGKQGMESDKVMESAGAYRSDYSQFIKKMMNKFKKIGTISIVSL